MRLMSTQPVRLAIPALSLLTILVTASGCNSHKGMAAGESAGEHRIYLPDQIKWTDSPPSLPGVKMAVLDGDPTKPGPFCMRLRLPDGYRVMPHWHPMTERV